MPTGSVLLAQAWQGSPYSPALGFELKGNDPAHGCELRIRNNSTGGNPGAPGIKLGLGACTPGRWHTFLFALTPHAKGQPGAGKLVAYHDDMARPVATWNGDLGYAPGLPVDVNGVAGKAQSSKVANKVFTLFVGPYRGRQNARIQTFWANVKFAFTPALVRKARPFRAGMQSPTGVFARFNSSAFSGRRCML